MNLNMKLLIKSTTMLKYEHKQKCCLLTFLHTHIHSKIFQVNIYTHLFQTVGLGIHIS